MENLLFHSLPTAPLAALIFSIPGPILAFYLSGAAILIIGLIVILKSDLPQAKELDKFIPFGRIFFAVPLAVFGVEHFIFATSMANMVPSWIPWHLFWIYLVGAALIAAALSIATGICSRLAGAMLSFMILSFVCMLHIPNWVAHPHDRFAMAVALRDLAFSAGALALAVTPKNRPQTNWQLAIVTITRLAIAIPMVVFGVEHFLYPSFVPVVPLERAMPAWVPAPHTFSCLIGTAMLATALCIIVNWKSRKAAIWLGIVILFTMATIYLPILIAAPLDVANAINYFADTLMMNGAVLLLAGALPKD